MSVILSTGPTCSLSQLLCSDRLSCVSQSDLCDGRYDCEDGSDENGCDIVYRARPSLPARVVTRSIILSACGAEGREGLADVISIHSRLTNQILLSRTGKQLVHNFERARSTPGSTSVALWAWLERMERDGSLLTSAVEYGLSKRV